jgi:hypothetical protein
MLLVAFYASRVLPKEIPYRTAPEINRCCSLIFLRRRAQQCSRS